MDRSVEAGVNIQEFSVNVEADGVRKKRFSVTNDFLKLLVVCRSVETGVNVQALCVNIEAIGVSNK